jgi:uncharacterized protein
LPPQKTFRTYLDWYTFDVAVQNLTKQLQNSGLQFDCIYGVPRGGLILAVCLSHTLNLPLTPIISYNFTNSKILFVDDTCDSGRTLESLKLMYPKSFFSTIYFNKQSKLIRPDFYVWEQRTDEWIVFPWESSVANENIKKGGK